MSRRSSRPRPPALTRPLQQLREQKEVELRKAEGVEQRSVLRGLLFLALLVAIFALFRSGGALFAGGGWRRW